MKVVATLLAVWFALVLVFSPFANKLNPDLKGVDIWQTESYAHIVDYIELPTVPLVRIYDFFAKKENPYEEERKHFLENTIGLFMPIVWLFDWIDGGWND